MHKTYRISGVIDRLIKVLVGWETNTLHPVRLVFHRTILPEKQQIIGGSGIFFPKLESGLAGVTVRVNSWV
eukprot:137380-Amorphochlora_amoeboformis.AAC.1